MNPQEPPPIYKINEIAAALAKAQGEFLPVEKDGAVNAGKFSYRYSTISAIRKATTPALSKNGLAVTQVIDHIGDLHYLRTVLMHTSGQTIESEMVINVALKPQDLGSLLTYLRRYQLAAILGIVADEDEDGQMAQNAAQPAKQGKTQTTGAPKSDEPHQSTPRPAKASIYNGTAEQQKIVKEILTAKNVPEDCFAKIDELLMGKPSSEIYTIIPQVVADYEKFQREKQDGNQ